MRDLILSAYAEYEQAARPTLSRRSARRGAPVVLLLDIDYATLTTSTA